MDPWTRSGGGGGGATKGDQPPLLCTLLMPTAIVPSSLPTHPCPIPGPTRLSIPIPIPIPIPSPIPSNPLQDLPGMFVLFILMFYWSGEVFQNCVHTVACGVAGSWYFVRDAASNPTLGALRRTLTYSFGSVCLGSLLVALLKTIRFLLRYAQRAVADEGACGMLACFVLCCVECLVQMVCVACSTHAVREWGRRVGLRVPTVPPPPPPPPPSQRPGVSPPRRRGTGGDRGPHRDYPGTTRCRQGVQVGCLARVWFTPESPTGRCECR